MKTPNLYAIHARNMDTLRRALEAEDRRHRARALGLTAGVRIVPHWLKRLLTFWR